jgi:hypothetical protein
VTRPRRTSFIGRTLVTVLLLSCSWAAVFCLHVNVSRQRDRFPAERDLLYLPQPAALRVASLGHTELAADLVWIRQVLYFADQFLAHGTLDWLDRYLKTIVALDPSFRRAYVWAGIVLIYNQGPVNNAMVRQSNDFLELGLRRFPDDWELHFMLGANYLHELKTSDAKLKAEWKRRGAEHMRRAALTGKGPPWLPVLVATVLTHGGEKEAAIRHLEEILFTTEDENMRTHVRNKLKQLEVQALGEMERSREEFTRRWHAEMPYAPSDLFVILGEPPPETDVGTLALSDLMRLWAQSVEAETARP